MADELTLTTVHEPQLPPMAWLVTITGPHATVHHGDRVETWDTGFFEGAYAGRWLDDDPSLATDVFGSGLVIRDGAFHLVTPSHTLEALYYSRRAGTLTASNSLAFLVERLGITVPVRYDYGKTFTTLRLGIDKYERLLFSSGSDDFYRALYDNIRVHCGNRLELQRKSNRPACRSYGEYLAQMDGVFSQVFANASDPRRSQSYTPMSTMSSGYDSTAVAAVGRRHGCTLALSLETSRDGESDSGARIAQHLGIETCVEERPDTHAASLQDLAPFFATGMDGHDYNLAAFASVLDGALLLTGIHGDLIWGVDEKPNRVFKKKDNNGTSLQEFRLQQGFVHFPVPSITARTQPELLQVSHTPEMRPYRLFNDYDRPIPRRILEEAGVPRELFGQSKRLTTVLYLGDDQLSSAWKFRTPGLSSYVAGEIRERARRLGAGPSTLAYRVAALRWFSIMQFHHAVNRAFELRARIKAWSTPEGNARQLSDAHPASSTEQGEVASKPSRRRFAALRSRIRRSRQFARVSRPEESVLFLVGLDISRGRYTRPKV